MTTDYLIFVDDDEVFEQDALSKITNAFKEKDADAFVFNYKVINKKRGYKEYHGPIKKCSKKELMSTGVVRFVYKTSSIKDMLFDEKIGSGSEFLCGEDSVFINDFLKKTKKCYFCEDFICTISQEGSLWKDKIDTDNYLYVKGYVYKKIYGILYKLACLHFLKKTKRFSKVNYKKMKNGPKKVKEFYENR